MPNPVEGLLEVYEDIVEVLLVLEINFTEDSLGEDLLFGASFCFEDFLFFSWSLPGTAFGSQRDLGMTGWPTLEAKSVRRPCFYW